MAAVAQSIDIATLRSTTAGAEAEAAGFDLGLIVDSLRLTPEQRARQHDQALQLVLRLDQLRRERHARSERPS